MGLGGEIWTTVYSLCALGLAAEVDWSDALLVGVKVEVLAQIARHQRRALVCWTSVVAVSLELFLVGKNRAVD